MTQDTEDVVARVAAAIREALNEQGGSCAEALQDGEVIPDTGIYWFYGHQIDIPAIARAALKASDRQSLSDRIDVLEAENARLKTEFDEETTWDAAVDACGGLDQFDALAEAWVAREPIRRMVRASTSVFAKWANDELMSRYHAGIENIVQLAYTEGAAAGARAALHQEGIATDVGP